MNIVHYKKNFEKKYLNLIKIKSNQIKLDKIFEKIKFSKMKFLLIKIF